MSIYDYHTFEINDLSDANEIKRKFPKIKINLLHSYESLVWQGPYYSKIINERFKKKNVNYIVELKQNIGLILATISLDIKMLAISRGIRKEVLEKVLSIAKKKKVEILFIEKLKIKKQNKEKV
jgi:hypothetical protein